MMLNADVVDVVQTTSALSAGVFTSNALCKALALFNAIKVTRPDLKVNAVRRIYRQAFILLVLAIFFICGVLTLFMPAGSEQATVRGYGVSVACFVLLAMSAFEYWDTHRIKYMMHFPCDRRRAERRRI